MEQFNDPITGKDLGMRPVADKNGKQRLDKWGLNVFAFDVEYKENEKKMRKDMQNDAMEMLTVAGVKNVKGYEAMAHWAVAFMKWVLHVWARIRKHLC